MRSGVPPISVLVFLSPAIAYLSYVAIGRWLRHRQDRLATEGFESAGEGAPVIERTHDFIRLVGTVKGVKLTATFDYGEFGRSASNTVATPPVGDAVFLYLEPQGRTDAARARRGEIVDVQVGDGGFDAEVLVDGAPEDVARALLDATTRTAIRRWMPCRLSIDERGVVFETKTRITRAGDFAALFRLVARIASRAAKAPGEVEAAEEEAEVAGDPYRGRIGRDIETARAKRTAEIEELFARRNKIVKDPLREFRRIRLVGIATVVLFLVWQMLHR